MAVNPHFAACPVCDAVGTPERPLLRCAGCLSECYCSPEHQREHWKAGHKKRCKEVKKSEEETAVRSSVSAGKHSNKARQEYNRAVSIMQGDPRHAAKAVPHLRAAADMGYVAAATNLAALLCSGAPGVPRDEREALRLFRVASDGGDTVAMYNLGMALLKPIGAKGAFSDGAVERNPIEGARLLRGAAEAGDEDACALLSRCYAHGDGVPRDPAEALKWRRKAERRGRDSDSVSDLSSEMQGWIGRMMEGSSEIDRAMKLVGEGKDGGGGEGGLPRGTRVPGGIKQAGADGRTVDGIICSGVVSGNRQVLRPVDSARSEDVVAVRIDALAEMCGLSVPAASVAPDTEPGERMVEFLARTLSAKILPVGTHVILEGLRAERLNGQTGVVVASPDGTASTGKDLATRQAVRLDSTNETVSVKPANLRRTH
jgi:hypothetical protein